MACTMMVRPDRWVKGQTLFIFQIISQSECTLKNRENITQVLAHG